MKLPWQEKDVVLPKIPNEDISTTALNEPVYRMSSLERSSSVRDRPDSLLEIPIARNDEDSTVYLSGFKLYIIVFGLSISVLLVALVCTAHPSLTMLILTVF